MEQAKRDDKAKGLVRAGSQIAGAAVGGALGFLAGGPIAAAGAALAGSLFTEVLAEVASRQLSTREEIRIGAAAAVALSQVKDRLELGHQPRTDGVASSSSSVPADAESLLEGVLLRAKAEHEEKKVRLVGNLFANVMFSPDVSFAEANHFLRIAETMTYRQFCIVSILHRRGLIPTIHLHENEFSDPNFTLPISLLSLLQEIYQLADLGLISRQSDEIRGNQQIARHRYIVPVSMSLSDLGSRFALLFDVPSIPPEDISPILSQLRLE